ASDAANHFKKFPTVDSAVGDDFTVFPTFVPTDTLEHLKNFGKNTRKSTDAVAEFASPKGLRILSFVHELPSKNFQRTDNRSCTSKPRQLGIPGKRTGKHKPI
ncbi:unnamed protein product, partial [Porites lobata]